MPDYSEYAPDADNYIPLEDAQTIVGKINAVQPAISPWGELAVVAYQKTPATENAGPNGERDYYAVWKSNGFSQNCQDAASRAINYGPWVDGMRQEYNDYAAGHQESMAGAGPGFEDYWTFVE